MRTFRPDPILSTLGLETWVGPGLPLSWKTAPSSECQRSDVWGLELRWLLWAACSSLRGLCGPPGVGAVWALSLSPPWGMEAPQVGYLAIIPIFQHIWVE